jgi:GH18 family chitinase
VLLSIRGCPCSDNFAAVHGNSAGRSASVTSAVDLVKNLRFDVLDIDWEVGFIQGSDDKCDLAKLSIPPMIPRPKNWWKC